MKIRVRRNIWKISASEKVTKEPSFWKDFKENNIVAIGEYGEGDLDNYRDIEKLEKRLTQLRNTKHSYPTAKFCFQFRDEVDLGDIIIVYARNTIFGVGYVISDYFYKTDSLGEYYPLGIPNRREVKWIITKRIKDDKLDILRNPQAVLFKLNKKQEKVVLKVLKKHDMLRDD